jgi:hypothetical protein
MPATGFAGRPQTLCARRTTPCRTTISLCFVRLASAPPSDARHCSIIAGVTSPMRSSPNQGQQVRLDDGRRRAASTAFSRAHRRRTTGARLPSRRTSRRCAPFPAASPRRACRARLAARPRPELRDVPRWRAATLGSRGPDLSSGPAGRPAGGTSRTVRSANSIEARHVAGRRLYSRHDPSDDPPAPETDSGLTGSDANRPERRENPANAGLRSAPERIRTSDLRFRRPTLYPAELRAHGLCSVKRRGRDSNPRWGLSPILA